MKKVLLTLILLLSVMAATQLTFNTVYAQEVCYPPGGTGPPSAEQCKNEDSIPVETSPDPSQSSGGGQSAGDVGGTGSDELDKWLNTVINLFSALVGITVVGSIIFAGIQYITSGDNSSQVAAAKQRITMSVLGLLLFFMGYAFLQWLIPGGIW